MGLYLQFRRKAKQILVQPRVNSDVRSFLSAPLLAGVMPPNQVARIPVIGKVPVEMPDGSHFVMETDGDDAIASLLAWQRQLVRYEPDTTQLFLKLVANSRTFFDIGANTGLYALAAAANDPVRQVYAFEPFPAIYAYLVRNIAVNGFANLHAFPFAVSDFVGSTPFYIPSASAVFPFSASTAAGLTPLVKEIQVAATTLDRFVVEEGVERVDLMKVDTETTEPQVLAGAAAVLGNHRPLVICEVLPFGKEQDLHDVLDPLDYRYFWIKGEQLIPNAVIKGDPTMVHMNYLMAPAERVQELPGN